jgi:hypothetical protein
MVMGKLEKLYQLLQSKSAIQVKQYRIPDLWNVGNYVGDELCSFDTHELNVNPYRFYASIIKNNIFPFKNVDIDYSKSLSIINNDTPASQLGGSWIHRSFLYSLLIRTSTAWDHDHSGSLDSINKDGFKETGTFVKTLALLPLLKKMGIDTLYLLPLTRFSLLNKKGDLGSPYGVASFSELDPDLKDSLTGDSMTVEEEFLAFIEACHILALRVTIDIIPRTHAVDNDLMKIHPDWFYWIKASESSDYRVPSVPGLGKTLYPAPDLMPYVYASPDVKRHIAMFQIDPQSQNPELWKELLSQNQVSLAEAIKNQFNLMIAPGFSDQINDTQPPWSDITFFRLYLDHPTAHIKLLDNPHTPPYILFDTIKAVLYPGAIPNWKLWDLLANIIPHFQNTYGIDGARIDMGHALPQKLHTMIFSRARAIDSDFAFIAEEMNPFNAQAAQAIGYNVIIGNGFWMEPRINEGKLTEFVFSAPNCVLPMFAGCETHDTPRIAGRPGGRILARMVVVLNLFIPTYVPFMNSGQEVYEVQPINTGVDCQKSDLWHLPKTDPYYGKLALFDKYAFHYLDDSRWDIPVHLEGLKSVRARWLTELNDVTCFVPLSLSNSTILIGLGYYQKSTGNCLMIFVNPDCEHDISPIAKIQPLRDKSKNQSRKGMIVYATYADGGQFTNFDSQGSVILHLLPGEVKIVEM